MGRSVFSSLSRCNPSSQDVPLYRSSLEADPSKVFLLTGPSAKKQTPNSSFIKSHPSRMPFSFSSCTLFGEPIKFSLHRHCPHTCALLALTLLPSTSLHRHGSDAPTLWWAYQKPKFCYTITIYIYIYIYIICINIFLAVTLLLRIIGAIVTACMSIHWLCHTCDLHSIIFLNSIACGAPSLLV
jgi:hypothetical protein